MDVSIIIVNYKSADLIINCIESIYKNSNGFTYEINIIDNGSKDDSYEKLVGKYGNKINYIDAKGNLGFGRANNLGVQYAKGEYIFFLNPDTLLLNNSIKYLLDYLICNSDDVGIVGGNLYSIEMTPSPSYCLKFDSLLTEWINSIWLCIIYKKVLSKIKRVITYRKGIKEFNHSNSPKDVAYIFGADMLMKKELFLKLGGFDPDFFMYSEEQDLSLRCNMAGYKSVSVPQAKILHIDGGTQENPGSFDKNRFMRRIIGRSTYFHKWYGNLGRIAFLKSLEKKYSRLKRIANFIGATDQETLTIYNESIDVINSEIKKSKIESIELK